MKLTKSTLKRLINEEVQRVINEGGGIRKVVMDTTVPELLDRDPNITLQQDSPSGMYTFTFCGISGRGKTVEEAIEDCFRPGRWVSGIGKLVMKSIPPR